MITVPILVVGQDGRRLELRKWSSVPQLWVRFEFQLQQDGRGGVINTPQSSIPLMYP